MRLWVLIPYYFLQQMNGKKLMNKYSIITAQEVTTEYIVKAKNKEEAEEKFYDGEYEDMNELNYHDERIVSQSLEEENVDEW